MSIKMLMQRKLVFYCLGTENFIKIQFLADFE